MEVSSVKGVGVHQRSSKAPSSSNSLQRFTSVGSGSQALPPKMWQNQKETPLLQTQISQGHHVSLDNICWGRGEL